MEYYIAASFDKDREFLGPVFTGTTKGPLVFVFTDKTKLEKYLEAIRSDMPKEVALYGYISKEAKSLDDLISDMTKTFKKQNIMFRSQDDPLFDQTIDFYRNR